MPAKPARNLPATRRARPPRKLAAVRSATTGRKGAPRASTSRGVPTLAPGWSNYDPQAPLVNVALTPDVRFLIMTLKVSDASKASWSALAYTVMPDLARPNLPCAVRDASSGKTYPAMATVSSGGVVFITKIGTDTSGAMAAPFAIGLGDMVFISFVYYRL